MKEADEKLQDALTPEQKAERQECWLVARIKAAAAPLQLSDEQLGKAKAAYREIAKKGDFWRGTAEGASGRPHPRAENDDFQTPRNGSWINAVFQRARLSGEQMKKVEAIVDELAKTTDPKGQWQPPFDKLQKKVNDLLTPEQMNAMKPPPVERASPADRCNSGPLGDV